MPGGHPPPKVMEPTRQLISPPPASLTRPRSMERDSASDMPGAPFAGPGARNSPVLRSKSTRDVVALIFVLLMLPQGISCIVLTAYILSGSFKSLAGKSIARHLLKLEPGVEFNLEGITTTRFSSYRSKLVGEFLQLFSINSFILLVCHYTLPPASLQYLIVMAKSIIASKLVGTFTTGSTTYMSVVSTSPNSSGVVTTTTTSTSGHGQKLDTNYLNSSFVNFSTGFSVVVAINHFLRKWVLNLNFTKLVHDIVSFYHDLLFQGSAADSDYNNEQLFKVMFTKSPLLASFQYLSSNKALYYSATRTPRQGSFSKLLISVMLKYVNLGENTCRILEVILRQSSNVISFAYLVLCIHVITLTISPLSNKIFLLKNHSQTLDHLSCLAPDISYGAVKRSLASNRDAISDSLIPHGNSPQAQIPAKLKSKSLSELKLSANIAASDAPMAREITPQSLSAANFKTFCMTPSVSKTSSTAPKSSMTKTSTDRKRSNTSPSTTIFDRFFTISYQPIWSWLAAIKILATEPIYFSRNFSELSQRDNALSSPSSKENLQLALYSLDGSKAVFEILNAESSVPQLEVRVNGIDWQLLEVLSEENVARKFLSVYGLFPNHQFNIDFLINETVVCRHSVRTNNEDGIQERVSEDDKVGLLKSSLTHTILLLNEAKAAFKKSRKEENRKVADLRKQIETLRSKLHKLENKDSMEGRNYSKIKGLQNAISQLDNEIKDTEAQIERADSETCDDDSYHKEESLLKQNVARLEEEIESLEKDSASLKTEMKLVSGEKHNLEVKLKKLEAKAQAKENEVVRLNTEIKGLRRAVAGKIQYRQKRAQDRLNTVIPQVLHEAEALEQAFAELDRR